MSWTRAVVRPLQCTAALLIVSASGPVSASDLVPGPTPEMQQQRRVRWMESSDQVLVAPYYSTQGRNAARLVLMNRFAEPIDYQVRALSSQGRSFPLGGDTLPGRGVIEVDLSEALSIAPPPFQSGSVEVTYFGDSEMAQAWVLLSGDRGDLEELLVKRSKVLGNDTIAYWDVSMFQKIGGAEPLFAIHNAGEVPAQLSLSWASEEERPWSEKRVLGPSQTVFIHRPPPMDGVLRGKFSMQYDGEPGTVVVAGLAVQGKKERTALSRIEVYEPGQLDSGSTFEGLDPVRGRDGETFLTIADTREDGDPRVVRVALVEGRTGAVTAFHDFVFRPGGVQTVSLSVLLEATGRRDAQDLRPRVSSDQGSFVVTGQSLLPKGEVLDLTLMPTATAHDAGTYPVPPLDRFNVTTSWVNLGREKAELFGYFVSAQGEYALEPIEIPAGGTYSLDFRKMASSASADRLGRTVDIGDGWGFFQWLSRRGSTDLIARTEAYRLGHTDRVGFNCFGCCAEFPTGSVLPSDVGFDIGETPSFETLEWVDTCAGMTGPYHAYADVLSYSSPLSWNGWTISTTGFTNQDVYFQGSGSYMTVTCQSKMRNFYGGGNATSDRCMKNYGPDGYDESPEAGGCPGQTSGCGECYTCCEKIKAVGECRCSFGGNTCSALAAQACFDCKQACFGVFAETCQTQDFSCN